MPPFIPKRRLNETPPPSSTPPAKRVRLAGTVEATTTGTTRPRRTPAPHIPTVSSDDSDSSLSDVDSDEFEDIQSALKDHEQEDDSDDDVKWEDAEVPTQPLPHAPLPTENISITIDKDDNYMDYGASSRTAKKAGPSKREKALRIHTHQMHVQFLLYHNLLRNSWTCDKDVQSTLVNQLPSQIRKEVDKWKRASGLTLPAEPSNTPKSCKKGPKAKAENDRDARDWGRPSSRLEPRAADMSRGDPLISLLKVLSAYWKKRFAITAPGLRKRGYCTKLELRRDLESYRSGPHDQELHGELLPSLDHFRTLARKCEGSRDVGAQLFTALLRGLGIESRLIASLQPTGYGWTKAEQMAPRKQAPAVSNQKPLDSDAEARNSMSKSQGARGKPPTSSGRKRKSISTGKGQKDMPIELDSNVEDGSDAESDSRSVIDVTPSMPKARRPLYDRELAFPIYWTEAISPITSKPIPCSPLVLENPVATTDEFLAAFEPRGAKAEASKLVMAYVVGYSSDNTAKDLTVRYLRKRIFPGKAKPFRFPIQSIPVYSSSGTIKRYEDYDWFKTVLSPYTRPDKLRTATDDIEETTDLIPQEPEKKNEEDGIDTLTSLKGNPDFVLERHLRREEAVRPGVKPDRMFISGKEPNLKSEPVYRRSDIERCLTAESWHKEGRRPINGEVAMKLVPVRAVTLTRKREAEEHQRITGEKQLQGLYSWDQTEYIIPPPIENGVIPKNSYGNIDAFVPTMVPRGAVHVPLRSTVRLCKKLEIDYAEAVVGFEFGNKRAVPVIRGVVVAKENEKLLRDTWKEYDEAQRKKEETKMERLVLDLWRKFVMGLRIRKEVGEVYGGRAEASGDNSIRANKGENEDAAIDVDEDEDTAGGFEPETNEQASEEDFGGGFLLPDDEDQLQHEDLVMEDPQGTQDNVHAVTEAGMEELAAEESEVSPHIPVRSRKGKEKEVQYPTPVSMPEIPPKALIMGKKKSSLRQTDNSNSTDEQSDSELSSMSEPPPTPAEAPPSRSFSNTPSSSEPESESESESEPDYLPPSKTTTTTTTTNSHKRRRHRKHPPSTRNTHAPSNPPSTGCRSAVTKNHNRSTAAAVAPSIKAAAATTPSKRRRDRSKKVTITSPYFDAGAINTPLTD